MSTLRLTGSSSGWAQIQPEAVAGDQTFTLPGTGGTLDRLNRAGNILQVVNATYSTTVTSTSSTYADTGLSASITPSSASSKVLVCVCQVGLGKSASNSQLKLRLLRDSTSILVFELDAAYTGSGTIIQIGGSSVTYLDSPATASSVTYKTQFGNDGSGTVYAQSTIGGANSTITLLEVAA